MMIGTKTAKPDHNNGIFCLLGFYALFGVLHELFHIVFFYLAGSYNKEEFIVPLSTNDTIKIFLRALIGRYSVFPVDTEDEDVIFIARHAGWICSLSIALALHSAYYYSYSRQTKFAATTIISSETCCAQACIAAYVTAFEAIVTDLFGFVPSYIDNSSTILFCGNFGILLINDLWIKSDGGKTALDVLERMVNVTMMRGAQCGGVVTFTGDERSTAGAGHPMLEGTRSRVVNGKRTDLSKGIRKKIEKDTLDVTGKIKGNPKGFYGHTRFATSSKATFDGCHPHRWTPKRSRRFYYPFRQSQKQSSTKPEKVTKIDITVENYVTHNGDFDFYQLNHKNYDLVTVQKWLEKATGAKMPSTVDSCAIAGVIDLIRTQGCFGLSARYALCLGLSCSKIDPSPLAALPTYKDYEQIGSIFEEALDEILATNGYASNALDSIATSSERRVDLVALTYAKIQKLLVAEGSSMQTSKLFSPIAKYVGDEELGGGWYAFIRVTIDAFFDNDLFYTMKEFLANAKGSFGLAITSNLDAHRQFCIGARGQPMSVAFYPKKGLICYGSEQAAVKAGLSYNTPGGDIAPDEEENEAARLDLDDLGGEICLLDWDDTDMMPAVSQPNRHLQIYRLMENHVRMILFQESNVMQGNSDLNKRITKLEGNDWIIPLKEESEDPILADIHDIPRICENIQREWKEPGLNRLTAWNLMKCVRNRMQALVDGKLTRNAESVDILVTGCEVSLWLAEQFASDLQKCFTKLFIKSVSSNKLLGLFGQELSIPCVGHPMSTKTHNLHDTIVIIVSHSGGTFAPLACSNMLQSFTRNIFVVTSEWDTQIGKQLRSLYCEKEYISSRIFVTDVGVRPAEPCSVSVAATHQLLTTLFIFICDTIVGIHRFRHVSGAKVTEYDLKILETCNQQNIVGMESIVGVDWFGEELPKEECQKHHQLRSMGNLWANHILENAKAYVMTFIYVFVTVIAGYPLVTGIATTAGLTSDWAFYLTRFLDSCIYFLLPQINVLIIRLIEGRNMRHRMVGRTVVVGDIPWVAQAAEAFLSKIFACSYSIAGLNVLSGNPSDHLVHRHTHRVTRGSLLVCGRPDGRLSALTTAEATTCLSVNQASSIQSIGGTCESITIGHNPYKLPLSHAAIVLDSYRPQFLCETVLDHIDEQEQTNSNDNDLDESVTEESMDKLARRVFGLPSLQRSNSGSSLNFRRKRPGLARCKAFLKSSSFGSDFGGGNSNGTADLDISDTSSHRLMGVYSDLQATAGKDPALPRNNQSESATLHSVLHDMLKEARGVCLLRKMFDEIDLNGDGRLDLHDFIQYIKKHDSRANENMARKMFEEADRDEHGEITFDEFLAFATTPQSELVAMMQVQNRTAHGLSYVESTKERYFGEEIRKNAPVNVSSFNLSKSQHLAMELYESRIASMQRFVAMTVMFHQMGKRVQEWFQRMTFGFMGYRMDRTHSIMRIATTASPVSGADVRERMKIIQMTTLIRQSVDKISRMWLRKKAYREKKILKKVMSDADLKSRLLQLDQSLSTMDSEDIMCSSMLQDKADLLLQSQDTGKPTTMANDYESWSKTPESHGIAIKKHDSLLPPNNQIEEIDQYGLSLAEF